MSDRFFYPLIILVMAAVVVLAAVWPQGDGARSPAPFGERPTQQVAEEARVARAAADARRTLQTPTPTDGLADELLRKDSVK